MATDIKTRINTLLILLFFHVSNAEKIPPKAKKTSPIISIILTENKKPKCARKAPITVKPIVKIKRADLKSLIADFLSPVFIFK